MSQLLPRLRGRAAVAAGFAVFAVVAAGIATPAIADRAGQHGLSLSADVDQVKVTPVPCANQGFVLSFGNTGTKEVYADAFLDAPDSLQLSRYLVSSYLPAGYTLKVAITVSASGTTPPGRYSIGVRAGDQRLSLPVEVGQAPVNDTPNVLRYQTVSASSEHLPAYPACGAIDGDRDSAHWASTTGWNDATKGYFPDWLMVTFDRPQVLGRVDLYTLDSAKYPASAFGLRDWDVQAQVGGAWQTLAQVRGNLAGLVSSSFAPVTATALRVVTLASNEGLTYSRVVELEAYAS